MHVNLSIHMKCLLQNFISLILVLLKQLSAIFKPLDKQDWCLCYPEFPFVLKIVESSKNFIYYSYSSYYYNIFLRLLLFFFSRLHLLQIKHRFYHLDAVKAEFAKEYQNIQWVNNNVFQVSEGQWTWDENIKLEYTSGFFTGVYGMWNIYTFALICLYAPSHKRWPKDQSKFLLFSYIFFFTYSMYITNSIHFSK